MNVILFESHEVGDPIPLDAEDHRTRHILETLRAKDGDEVRIGEIGGLLGTARVRLAEKGILLARVALDREPPAPIPVRLVLAMPRPKVLNRIIASVTSLGVKRIHLINSWRVDKSYWGTPNLSSENLHRQCVAGLQQSVDTVMPTISVHKLFRPFVENELGVLSRGSMRIVAHPRGTSECPHLVDHDVTLVVGPEGGFIEPEIESFLAQKFNAVRIGPRLLRVETAVTALLGRLAG